MNKPSIRIAAMFSLMIFTALVLTMLTTGFLLGIFYRLGIVQMQNPLTLFLIGALLSVVIGTALSRHMTRHAFVAISNISEATKAVAKGDFSVRLDEQGRAMELRTMAQNFNLMAQELANTEIFRSDFISNVSHEFKTPLSTIEGYATLMQADELSEEKRKIYAGKILSSAKRLSTLAGNILLLSRLEQQQINTGAERFSLDEQLRETLLLFEAEWTKKKLELDVQLEELAYEGNADLLFQVWQNLIGNAVKFSQENGFLRILLHRQDDRIFVNVVDNGVGMNLETQQRIFEKFYQGDTSHAMEGNGLGLALAKRIVEMHGGKIEVSSREGRGTTMTVSLPYARETGKEQ